MRRASLSRATISAASMCSIPSREPRAIVFMVYLGHYVTNIALTLVLFLDQQDFFALVGLAQLHFNDFLSSGLYFASDKCRLDWQLAVAAINQHAESHLPRTSLPEEGIKRSTSSAPRIENVIHQDYIFAGDGKADFGFLHHRFRTESGKIVAI